MNVNIGVISLLNYFCHYFYLICPIWSFDVRIYCTLSDFLFQTDHWCISRLNNISLSINLYPNKPLFDTMHNAHYGQFLLACYCNLWLKFQNTFSWTLFRHETLLLDAKLQILRPEQIKCTSTKLTLVIKTLWFTLC